MRQPQPFIISTPKSAQQGFSLFIVLMVMIVVAFLVVSVTQSYNTEQRISTNDADHKYAFALAEAALRAGEERLSTDEFESVDISNFTDNCKNGLCSATDKKSNPDAKEAWERSTCDDDKVLCIDMASEETEEDKEKLGAKIPQILGSIDAKNKPRYIIEYISTQTDGTVIYRVTAKAWGQNSNTVVILQSYVAAS